jgi:rhodanese-related sulfurtransferase
MRALLALLAAALLLVAGCGGDDEPPEPRAASGSPAVRAVAAGDATLLDVRTDEEWEAGHAAGAIHLPLADIQAGARPDVPKDAALYVYCRTGRRAGEAVQILERDGWTDVTNVGGLDDWERAGGAVQEAGASPTQ